MLLARPVRWVTFAAMVVVLSASCRREVADPPAPTLFGQIEPTLTQTCAVAHCHDHATAAAGLDLSPGTAWFSLVDVPSTQVPVLKRVQPGSASASYLVNKLEDTQGSAGGNGTRMPPGGSAGSGLIYQVKLWINGGAARD